MPVKKVVKADQTDEERPKQQQPDTERYLLQIDRQTKRSFKTPEDARSAALEIKARFPALQVSIYDSVNKLHTVVDTPSKILRHIGDFLISAVDRSAGEQNPRKDRP